MMKSRKNFRILIIDDEPKSTESLSIALSLNGFPNCRRIHDSGEVMDILESEGADLVLLDLTMPEPDGLTLLRQIKSRFSEIGAFIVTAHDDVESAVESLKLGAEDFVTKPVEIPRLVVSINNYFEKANLVSGINSLQDTAGELENPGHFRRIATQNQEMRRIFSYVEKLARTEYPILILGETGTGKELLARAVHDVSEAIGPFIPLNAAGMDDHLFSDTLFGHVRGAFTDGHTNREGLVARARNGTIFLDEIGDLSLASQIKLLRLLQEQEYYPLGSDTLEKADTRFVVATNRTFSDMTDPEKFRQDLFYRLQSHRIQLPPLRDRIDDLPILCRILLSRITERNNLAPVDISEEGLTILKRLSFPGNIRELEGILTDLALMTQGARIETQLVADKVRRLQEQETGCESIELRDAFQRLGSLPSRQEAEDALIREALDRFNGNQSVVSKALGVSRSTINKWVSRSRDSRSPG